MTGPLRIVQYITPSQIGGAEMHVSALAGKLRQRGHDVTVVCPRGRALVADLVARGLRVKTPRTTGKVDPVTLARICWWLRQERAQVIHTHLSTASLIGSAAARIARVPAVATVHGLNTRRCFEGAHAVIAVSDAVKQHLVAQGMSSGRITVVHNGVDLKEISETEKSTGLKEEWGFPAGAPVVVTVGRLSPEKRHGDLLAAMAKLSAQGRWRELRLVIVGSGMLGPALKREAERLGLGGRVVFAGFQREVLPFLRAADVFVLPSVQEGMSLSALEAMGLGKPVIACRVGGTPEVVVNGENGVLVAPGRPEELARALEDLLADRGRARAMGAAARRCVAEAFNLEQMVSKVEAVYREVIERHSGSG